MLVVAKRTGRKFTEPPRVLNPAEVTTEAGDQNLAAVAKRGVVQWQYPDVALSFKRSRGTDGKGVLCFRITEIEWRGANE